MELKQLKCFVEAADTLHFGRAAQLLCMMPATFGHHIHVLETELRARLFVRSTRRVALTEAGLELLPIAKALLRDADFLIKRLHERSERPNTSLRVGAIDSAAAGLLPSLINDIRCSNLNLQISIVENKTTNLIQQLLSGSIDIAFIRPSTTIDPRLTHGFLFYERPMLAVSTQHTLATANTVSICDLATLPMIVPPKIKRPHSHGLAMSLFERHGIKPLIVQEAEEKHTIFMLVSSNIGAAIVPRWSTLSSIGGVTFLELPFADVADFLPVSAVWLSRTRDPARDMFLDVLSRNIPSYQTI